MTTKEWLNRAQNIDREIGFLLRERKRAFDRATSITSRLNATCVTSTKDPHKYDAFVEYDMMVDAKVDELFAVKQEIQKAIFTVNDRTLRELLQRRYINGERWEKIANDMNYSYRHTIMELHPKALAEISKHIT